MPVLELPGGGITRPKYDRVIANSLEELVAFTPEVPHVWGMVRGQFTRRYWDGVEWKVAGVIVYTGPIASAPAASLYPAGVMWWDNTTGKSWKAVESIWVSTDYDYPSITDYLSTKSWRMPAIYKGLIYVPVTNDAIYIIDPSSKAATPLAGTAKNWRSLVYNNFDGFLYGTVFGGSIYRINPSTGAQTDLVVAARNWYGIAIASDGFLYADVDGGSIYRINPSTGAQTDLVVAANAYQGIAFNTQDGMLYVSAYNGTIYRVNPKNGTRTSLGVPSKMHTGLAFCSDDGFLYDCVADASTGGIYRTNPSTGAQTSINVGSKLWIGVVHNPYNKEIYATVFNGSFYQLNPAKLP